MSKSSWGLIHSWWLILPFTFPLYLNWTAFLYVGITARHRIWILYGVIYAIPSMLLTFINSTTNPNEIIDANSIMGILIIITYLIGCISIIHAFSLREEYLIRLKALKNVKNDDNLRKKIAREYGLDDRNFSYNQEHSTGIKDEKQADSDEFVKDFPHTVSPSIDINNDPEDLLLKLPGINKTLAEKIIQLRQSGIYFDSAEDFGELLDLKPHVVERIKPLVVINTSGEETKIMKNKGRIVDI